MKIVKETFTVQPSFAEKNSENVKTFVRDIKDPDHSVTRYIVYLGTNGNHSHTIATFGNDEAQA